MTATARRRLARLEERTAALDISGMSTMELQARLRGLLGGVSKPCWREDLERAVA